MKKRRIAITTKYIILVCALLLVVNVVLGFVLIRQSGRSMNTLIRWHMLSVADTAAAALDGNALEALTEDDVGSAEFSRIAETLTKVINAQKDSDIKYIYATKKQGDHFVFTVDPDPVSPGAFGEEVVYTPAQDTAWQGTSAVDESTYSDKWGSFYTAWSPVRNSHGRVVGLVGVDFVADWYDQQVSSHTKLVFIFSTLSVIVGAAIMLLTTGQLRSRVRRLNFELSVLSEEVEILSDEIRVSPSEEASAPAEEISDGADTIGVLSGRIRVMQRKLKDYMDYAHEQAYTDSMTGAGNKAAYLDYVKELNRRINEGVAAFAVAVFDINGLKSINDNYGHECGDRIIADAAESIRRVFGGEQLFRIGGDEFIAVLGETSGSELSDRFSRLRSDVESFNAFEKRYSMTLAFAWGGAVYRPGEDSDFKDVFKRADEAMYANKDEFYRSTGAERRHGGAERK